MFILPSINNIERAIIILMNKQNQEEFARHNGISMFESTILDIELLDYKCDINFPRILKPVTYIEGAKS